MFVSVRAAVAGVLEKTVPSSDRPHDVHYVTPRFAEWVQSGGRNPAILEGNDAVHTAAASSVISRYLIEASALAERLLDQGVPEEVALGLLPYEVYVRLGLDKYDKKL
ncbi:MAG TPA: hypothetical protein VFS75_03405 [Candidatus Paceibacterota bacterium]|nr:hypothetical protein [Candidatus Paceibacterota bacterium]